MDSISLNAIWANSVWYREGISRVFPYDDGRLSKQTVASWRTRGGMKNCHQDSPGTYSAGLEGWVFKFLTLWNFETGQIFVTCWKYEKVCPCGLGVFRRGICRWMLVNINWTYKYGTGHVWTHFKNQLIHIMSLLQLICGHFLESNCILLRAQCAQEEFERQRARWHLYGTWEVVKLLVASGSIWIVTFLENWTGGHISKCSASRN